MFKSLFRPDSPLMIFMSRLTDCIFLSMFFFLGCLPIVTIGPAWAALYDAVYRGFRAGETNSWQRFLRTFIHSLKPGILPTLVFLPVAFGLGYGMIQCWNAAVYGLIPWMLFAAAALVAVVAVGVLSVLFPMLSRFENSFFQLLKNTVVLALSRMPLTLLLGFVTTVTLLLCVRLIIPLFFLPGMAAVVSTFLIEPMFKPYLPQEENGPEENSSEEAAE